MNRVVVTGVGSLTSLGDSWSAIRQAVENRRNGIQIMPQWQKISGMHTCLGSPINDFSVPAHYRRKQLRAMGRVARLATVATEQALQQAGLDNSTTLGNGRTGIAYGSCSGSTQALGEMTSLLTDETIQHINATTYIRGMSHTCAVNIALFFGILGRIIPTSSACTSSSQAIGYACETIRAGYQDVMLAGGAEELCPSQAAVFDTLYATSQCNNSPQTTPRPFDRDRDGLVIGEGACTFILESLDHARARGAPIYAEVSGFGTNCDARHVTQPTAETMQVALELALEDARLAPEAIGYVNAHGTATERGDIAESQATARVLGNHVPISAPKSYFGHTLGACGALEAWLAIEMMNRNLVLPTLNLEVVDDHCAALDYIINQPRQLECQHVMSNNFAFGGINTSLIFSRLSP